MHGVTLDIHTEDRTRLLARIISVLREFDATGLAATTDLHLCFDDYSTADLSRCFRRLIWSRCDCTF